MVFDYNFNVHGDNFRFGLFYRVDLVKRWVLADRTCRDDSNRFEKIFRLKNLLISNVFGINNITAADFEAPSKSAAASLLFCFCLAFVWINLFLLHYINLSFKDCPSLNYSSPVSPSSKISTSSKPP